MSTNHEIFANNLVKFKPLIDEVKRLNQVIIDSGRTLIGHDIDHDLMVGQIGCIISETDREGEETFVAGLCHSRDRHHGVDAPRVIEMLLDIVKTEFLEDELEAMRDAVARHSEFANVDNDSNVLKALKDADKLANSGAVNIFRCAQYNIGRPAFILEEMSLERPTQGSTFQNPRSCYDVFFFTEEWRPLFRMPKAVALGQKNLDYLRQHQRDIVAQLEEVGMHPWSTD